MACCKTTKASQVSGETTNKKTKKKSTMHEQTKHCVHVFATLISLMGDEMNVLSKDYYMILFRNKNVVERT